MQPLLKYPEVEGCCIRQPVKRVCNFLQYIFAIFDENDVALFLLCEYEPALEKLNDFI